ncbi:MAG TPA: hypothetical protein VIS07_09995 [Candidatus Binatia bacterium]
MPIRIAMRSSLLKWGRVRPSGAGSRSTIGRRALVLNGRIGTLVGRAAPSGARRDRARRVRPRAPAARVRKRAAMRYSAPVLSDSRSFVARRLAGAREDAQRIARELERAGHLAPDLAARLTGAVDAAIERARDLVADALREPRRLLALLDDAPRDQARDPGMDQLAARIAALEDAVARIERALAANGSAPSRAERERT